MIADFVADRGLELEFVARVEPEIDPVEHLARGPALLGHPRDRGEPHAGQVADPLQDRGDPRLPCQRDAIPGKLLHPTFPQTYLYPFLLERQGKVGGVGVGEPGQAAAWSAANAVNSARSTMSSIGAIRRSTIADRLPSSGIAADATVR